MGDCKGEMIIFIDIHIVNESSVNRYINDVWSVLYSTKLFHRSKAVASYS